MKAIVEITEVASGKTATYPVDEWNATQWEFGNYACDCNRRLFFDAAVYNSNFDTILECGERLFKVRALDENGTEIYTEFSGKSKR